MLLNTSNVIASLIVVSKYSKDVVGLEDPQQGKPKAVGKYNYHADTLI